MSKISRQFTIDGVETDMTSVKFSDATGTFGIKRNDTDAVVVADNTPLDHTGTGLYEYTFTDPAYGLTYTVALEVVYGGETYHIEYDFDGPTAGDPLLVVGTNSFISLEDAQEYMNEQLDVTNWTAASTADKKRALIVATRAINKLSFIGEKTDADQALQFPRYTDLTIPTDIEYATCELALAFLNGIDPAVEIDNLAMTKFSFGGVSTSMNRAYISDYIASGIPSPIAWNYLLPYLRDNRSVRLTRVS